MRKLFAPFIAGVLAISLTGCMPSGNIVGKASFTTYESNFADFGDVATIDINGGTVATPQGLRFRITKANFEVNTFKISANKFSYFDERSFPKTAFFDSRLKGKNFCGWTEGELSDGSHIVIAVLGDPRSDIQYLGIERPGFFWVGGAPANSLKIGGRNLCG